MALLTKNWKLKTYTDATWTNLVAVEATVATLILSNTDDTDSITVSVRFSDGTVVLPATILEAGKSHTLEARSINVMAGEQLQVQASVAGLHAFASGVTPS